MTETLQLQNSSWNFLQKILFRFFFIYFILYTSPWDSLAIIPGIDYLVGLYNQGLEWAVIKTNEHFFQVFGIKHVKPVSNGSGDTSFYWASNYFMLVAGGIGALIWSLIDWKRKSYRQLNYLLCLFIRYSLALIAFGYGINKVFALQMPFPMLSQLATPLGDLLPMRFSWLFIGYSAPYEIFSGIMEVLVAVLLLYRRTATLGALLATGVFINVMMLNLCYDIPVKLYSMNLVLLCLYLLVNEWRRISCFFVLNRPAASCSVYDYPLTKKWMRITRIIIKVGVVLLMCKSFYEIMLYNRDYKAIKVHKDFKPGMYDVTQYVVNKNTLPALITDTIRWKDVIIENNQMGSINTSDTMFRIRYGRAYFVFDVDTLQPIINFQKSGTNLFSLHYRLPDSNTIQLWGEMAHP
ncbi:MAG TPA: hypothetical protein VK484_09105, partial [Ferruginibacter sp.]|nr:hypothetical protein [Ferruginibacter sp.]